MDRDSLQQATSSACEGFCTCEGMNRHKICRRDTLGFLHCIGILEAGTELRDIPFKLRCYKVVEAAAAVRSRGSCLPDYLLKCEHQMLAHVHTSNQKVGPKEIEYEGWK